MSPLRTLRCALLVLLLPCWAGAAPITPFHFLHITDTHVTESGKNADAVRDLLAKVPSMAPQPAFIVNTGDVTELGRPAEFDQYLAAVKGAPVPMYAVPGNHDARWGPLGKEGFERALGPLYRSFDYGGCHFVLLDSTVLLEHHGHFDGAEIAWLQKDLKKLKADVPVFLFFHHWVGREGRQVDDEDTLLRAVAPYHVVAMFIGHGHSDIQWKVNGIQCVMARGLYQGSYHDVSVTPEQVTITRVRKEDAAPSVVATIPLKPGPHYRVGFRWDDINAAVLERRRLAVGLLSDKGVVRDGRVSAAYSMDGGPDEPMEAGTDTLHPGEFTTQFATRGLFPGAHVLTLKVTGPDGVVYTREEAFGVERMEGSPRRLWAVQTADTIQSSPVLADGTVYAASFDGKVYALDPQSGKQRWATATKGRIYATPLVADGTVYVGSMDHRLYALDARTGRVRWSYDTGSPIFASAAVAEGVVCFGGNRRIYGLDAATGAEKWTQEAGGFFQARAAAADGVFYLGGWDNTLYALDARTGQPRWKAPMGRTNGGRGSILFYYSPAIASPSVGDGRVYQVTDDGVLHAVDVQTGKDAWIARGVRDGDGLGYSSAVYADGRVYVGGLGESGRGSCYAFDARTGNLVWHCKTGADNYDSSPVIANGTVAIGSVPGKLTWIDAATGQVKWQYAMDPGFCFSTPATDGRTVWATSMNGRVYGIALPAGK